jgi:hypothetical protein
MHLPRGRTTNIVALGSNEAVASRLPRKQQPCLCYNSTKHQQLHTMLRPGSGSGHQNASNQAQETTLSMHAHAHHEGELTTTVKTPCWRVTDVRRVSATHHTSADAVATPDNSCLRTICTASPGTMQQHRVETEMPQCVIQDTMHVPHHQVKKSQHQHASRH